MYDDLVVDIPMHTENSHLVDTGRGKLNSPYEGVSPNDQSSYKQLITAHQTQTNFYHEALVHSLHSNKWRLLDWQDNTIVSSQGNGKFIRFTMCFFASIESLKNFCCPIDSQFVRK